VLSGKVALYTASNVRVCVLGPGDVVGNLSASWKLPNFLLCARALKNTATLAIAKNSYTDKWASYFTPNFTSAANFIVNFPAFQGFTESVLAPLCWAGVKRTFSRHSPIPHDLFSSSFCFIVSGEIQLKAGKNSANPKTMLPVAIIGQGQFFDPASSIVTRKKRGGQASLQTCFAVQCLTKTVSTNTTTSRTSIRYLFM
jgi:hypothetical protein